MAKLPPKPGNASAEEVIARYKTARSGHYDREKKLGVNNGRVAQLHHPDIVMVDYQDFTELLDAISMIEYFYSVSFEPEHVEEWVEKAAERANELKTFMERQRYA